MLTILEFADGLGRLFLPFDCLTKVQTNALVTFYAGSILVPLTEAGLASVEIYHAQLELATMQVTIH